MLSRSLFIGIPLLLLAGCVLAWTSWLGAQEAPPLQAPTPISSAPADPLAAPAQPAGTAQGIEVMARGPVHEAFATPLGEPQPTLIVAKAPPKALEELPPEQKPEGNVAWIGGYWSWDDDRKDYLWVSGIWRTAPPNKEWVPGYWRENNEQYQWVPGFWTQVQAEAQKQDVMYMPRPPAPPAVAVGVAPNTTSFYVPGTWEWHGDNYAWRPGYWAQVQPGYVWVASHYQWTPGGYVYIPGYWDLAVSRRGVLYAPVVVDPAVVRVGYVYTPGYVVGDTIVLDAMFVRPAYCHYYFGDYYGPGYRDLGYESCIVYSRTHYEPIIVYERYDHRDDPRWETVQINLYFGRNSGQMPLPPRTLVQQINNTTIINQTNVYKTTVLAPASQLSTFKNVRTTTLDTTTRMQVRAQARAIQQASVQRQQVERALPGVPTNRPQRRAFPFPGHNPRSHERLLPWAARRGPRPGVIRLNPATRLGPAGRPERLLSCPPERIRGSQPARRIRPSPRQFPGAEPQGLP